MPVDYKLSTTPDLKAQPGSSDDDVRMDDSPAIEDDIVISDGLDVSRLDGGPAAAQALEEITVRTGQQALVPHVVLGGEMRIYGYMIRQLLTNQFEDEGFRKTREPGANIRARESNGQPPVALQFT